MQFSKLEKFLSQKLDRPLPGEKDGGEEAGKLHFSEVPESKEVILESKEVILESKTVKNVEKRIEGVKSVSPKGLSPGVRKEASSFFGASPGVLEEATSFIGLIPGTANRHTTASDLVRSLDLIRSLPDAEAEISNIDSDSA